ncbi:hypothetical protein DYBT9275_02705 [Dyadobacter sp. CECT 9275]|uniref:Uncharacterized protein n=1 Tax=Dyadobacter helix TaxID=2822344 RepID=A0A916NCF4_9BACT|nr:hypothetical protein [Dyadobacter sp. CECT 9275]CAG5001620.1 hypothetical protein DYBT9275_02705 [Dyadobacter sp. CECT 9275]
MKEIMNRFVDWINEKGGPTPVAIAIGKTPQSFYNYTNRGSKPNMQIFALLANKFDDFDSTYILTGKKSEHPVEELKKKVMELEAERNAVQSMYKEALRNEALLGKGKGVSNHPQVDRPGSSEKLTSIVRKNIGIANLSSLSFALKNSRPN